VGLASPDAGAGAASNGQPPPGAPAGDAPPGTQRPAPAEVIFAGSSRTARRAPPECPRCCGSAHNRLHPRTGVGAWQHLLASTCSVLHDIAVLSLLNRWGNDCMARRGRLNCWAAPAWARRIISWIEAGSIPPGAPPAASHGRQSHFLALLYISFVILHTKQTGENDSAACGYRLRVHPASLASLASLPASRPASRPSRPYPPCPAPRSWRRPHPRAASLLAPEAAVLDC
jgi:hypothetical protein